MVALSDFQKKVMMKNQNKMKALLKQVLYIVLMMFSFSTFSQPGNGWLLVFEDEFNGTELDLSKWSQGYTWGRTHNHRAYMADEQVRVEDGRLKITAIDRRHPNAPDGTNKWSDQFGYLSFDYTSGAIHSNGKFNVTYGYIEGRFKMSGHGTWPAFWTMNGGGEWPPEIDILEVPHARTNHHYYYHYGDGWENEQSFGGQHNGVDKSLGFHNYGVEWGPSWMNFYFDGQRVASYTGRNECAQGNNMYLIINLAVGGWSGDPTPSDVFPTTYECEWVRVWQRDYNTGNWDLEDGELGQWGSWNDVRVVGSCSRSGNYGLQLTGSPASSERTINVEPNKTYVFGGWGRKANGATTMIGVKGYGGNELQANFTSTEWENKEIQFTTGSNVTTARIYFYQSAGSGTSCGDDFYLLEAVNDCNGVLNGNAYIDYCGECVGGNTGRSECESQPLQAEHTCYYSGVVESEYGGYEGDAYVNINMERGAGIELKTIAFENATENIIVRYANGGNSDRDCRVMVNGAVQNESVSFPSTGAWSNWEVVAVPVQLSAGENKIEILANQESGGPNFDWFSISGSLEFQECGIQTIQMEEGWNLFSYSVSTDVDVLNELVMGGVKIIKNEESFFNAELPEYLSTIHALLPGKGYLIYSENQFSLGLSGYVEQPNLSVTTNSWQLLPSFYADMPIADYLQRLGEELLFLKDFNEFYSPNDPLNTLHLIGSGKAYFGKLNVE